MDAYDKKFAEMQKYIPFLEAMIDRLKKVKDKSREPQLQKMQSLHGILSNGNGKNRLTIEKLDRCEELLLKLHNRVDKVNVSGSNSQNNKTSEETKPNIAGTLKSETAGIVGTGKDSEMYRQKRTKGTTPASPSPPASPDQTSQSDILVKPIIIPTERKDGYTGTAMDDRPASPDECELVASVGLRQPVIIPTEPLDVNRKSNLLKKTDTDSANKTSRWSFPAGATKPVVPNKTNPWQSDIKPPGFISTVTASTASKITPDSRPRFLRHIPTVPTPSKGSSLIRKPVLVLDKKNLQTNASETSTSPTTKLDSSKTTVSEFDTTNPRALPMSPKSKDLPPLPKLPATELLESLPALTMPPLTNEDIAELLSGDGDGKTGRRSETGKESTTKVGSIDEIRILDKDNESRIGNSPTKDASKNSRNTHDDVESDRRWEEEYKHIVKMPTRRIFPSSSGTPANYSEIKFPPAAPPVVTIDRPTDPRKRPTSPVTKEREQSQTEPRYADNYEKHPRQSRDLHVHNSINEQNPINSAFPRVSDGDSNNSLQTDDRSSALYHRRSYTPAPVHDQCPSDPRREKSEYYNRMMQQEREKQQNLNNRAPLHHSPGRSSEPCNQSQWGTNSNYPSAAQGSNMPYQQQPRPDMWTMKAGAVNATMEPHMMNDPAYMRQGQYSAPSNTCRGPMISPQDMNHGPCMDPSFRDNEISNQSMIPPLRPPMVQPQHPSAIPSLIQPQGYPVGGQYRGFPPENRPPVQQFDRPQDFPHPRQSWDQPANRPPDNMPYPRQPAPGQWNRSNRGPPTSVGPGSLPPQQGSAAPVNRERPYNERGRGPEPPRPSSFNRDPRTRVEPSTGQTGNRRDHVPPIPPLLPAQNVNSSTPPSNVRRDPRYVKDGAQHAATKSKDNALTNDRNARRIPDTKNKHNSPKDVRKNNDKNRSQHNKNDKKVRRETENDNKNVEKPSKDVMQSPLESLYGVIDTAAKTGKGYGLQKFKIPKIKRVEPVPSPPRLVEETMEENWDLPEENYSRPESPPARHGATDIRTEDTPTASNRKESDDKKAEVTSTTGESLEDSRVAKEIEARTSDEVARKDTSVRSTPEPATIDNITKTNETTAAKSKESDGASTDQPPGDWQNLLEAKFLEKINELLHSKKMKEQFKKFIDSSSGSDKDNDHAETKKVASKKKRRLISSSESSDEECLAERLGIVETTGKDKPETTESRVNEDATVETPTEEEKLDKDQAVNEESSKNDSKELSNDTSLDTRPTSATVKKGKPFRRKKSEPKAKTLSPAVEPQQTNEEVPSSTPETNEPTEKPVTKEQPPKAKTRRRNSLEMLQEDVREMFISDEVVTATGFRTCRLQKEDQSHLNSSVESVGLGNSKKKGSTSSLDRLGARIGSDADETQPTNSRGRGGRGRSRRRTRNRTKQPLSVKEIPSSDSDDEDSSRLDPAPQNDTTAVSKTSDESLKSDTVDATANNKDESEETHFLRRSERVGLRGSMKEPRLCLKKTDSGKIDSSKIIFDSSSDESFGIDVSELTAAVDISLHPEPQNSSSPVGKTISKPATPRKRRSRKKKENAVKITDDKVDNVGSADEVESIATDFSRESSSTRGKKSTTAGSKTDTNEELLSDILGGLGDPNAPDGDNHGEGATTPSVDVKTKFRKKKKKKPVWQMGIVRKKKRKFQAATSTASVETEDCIVPNAELESSFEIPESKVDPADVARCSEVENLEIDPKEELFSDTSIPRASENPVGDSTKGSSLAVNKVEPLSPSKNSTSKITEEIILKDAGDENKPSIELVDGNKSDIEIKTESSINVGVRRLMSYVWSPRKDRFKCMICPWIGKNIVHHYTLGHPGREMMISRLSIPESKRALGQATKNIYTTKIPGTLAKDARKFCCRFCAYTFEGSTTTALEAFYEHCTTHTGEYRFRCNGCNYQTAARSSMKTHYYRRACVNKFYGNMSVAISEDPIPSDDFLYGYLCLKCNFVQLKETNVQKHVKNMHNQIPHVDIVKIDMSSYVDKHLFNSADDGANADEKKSDEFKTEDAIAVDAESKTSAIPAAIVTETTADAHPPAITEKPSKTKRKSGKSAAKNSEKTSTPTRQEEVEAPPVAGNLNAFVCPPELENKEDEIQHERRKKMQEVVDDIGITNKPGDKRDLSIIDKLKDKMTTDIDESVAQAEARQDAADAANSAREMTMGLPMLVVDSVTSLADGESKSEESQPSDGPKDDSANSEVPVKNEPTDSSDNKPEVAIDEAETDTEDNTEKKPKDPLANLEESRKDESTDGDDTDREDVPERPRSYETDSTDHSDGEITADVNSLLEESFNLNTPVNAPMMTTIQRLAAKLQGQKSLPVSSGEASETSQATNADDSSLDKNIPKPPNVIPISSIQRLFGKRNSPLQDDSKAVEAVEEPEPRNEPSSPPKKFIRLRRLSGDKLSVPVPSPEPRAATPTEVPQIPIGQTETNAPTEIVETNLDPSNDDECSFLRIENVISLAPGIDNNPQDSMINDIRMAVANSSKTSTVVSLLKKKGPNILQRPLAPIAIRQGPIQIQPVPSVSPKPNVKFVKVIKGRTLIKQKDSTHRVYGKDLKDPEIFADMLKPEKLRHLYKCMARTCSYTTYSILAFGGHYRKHKESIDRANTPMLTAYDFQRCAYCTETLTSWNSMCDHLKDKHIYCQYQCSYCFYRALAQSYVELHHMNVHQDLKPAVLLGVQENPPIEVIDRREFVIPFVCHHECGKAFYVPGAFLAHLRTKHGNSLSIFKCHLCPAPLFKAEQLVAHYKLHGIYKYQCLYCRFGSEQSSDVHAHLSASHYNRPPHILERTLQPRPVRDKDVIQQLVVLNVDEGYKCTELTLVEGQNVADIPKNKHWLQVDRNTSDGSAVGVVTLPIGNISMNRCFPYENLDPVDGSKNSETTSTICNPAIPIITKFRKVSERKSPDVLPIVNDSRTIGKSVDANDPIVIDDATAKNSEVDNRSVEGPRSSPVAAETDGHDVAGSTSGFDCNDEFLNFNILDNPGFIEAGSSRNVGDESRANTESIDGTGNKEQDSDIEILEDIEITPKKTATIDEKIDPASSGETSKGSPKDVEPETSKTTDAEAVIVCSSAENSLDLNLNANPVPEEVEETFEKPLTLDDIKNTGFTGRHLYRCGYDTCEFGAETSALLRTHIKECIFATETKNLNCVHCSKRFVKIGFLLEHFKLHGLKRFGCSLCKGRWTQPYQAMSHMKMKHRQTYSKIIPADPKNPSADGLFVVEPIASAGEKTKGKKRGRAKSAEIEKMLDVHKIAYGPTEIDSLPRQPIYQQEVHCAVCPYRNKVRTNIIRHLQLHAKDETVPESGPVNPVPCLDKNERMFDKMVNLASSSHQNGRMGGTKPKETIVNDAEFLPKFVPENKRYVCGVTECNYLSIDEGMLRTHVKALHPDEPYFRCPHCPAQVPGHEAQNIAIDKMGIHLKMHDTRLYKCSHCNHHHYHRHVVERHLPDKHPEANPFVKVIREIENTENPQQQTTQETEENSADPDGNHWKCNVCDHKCIYKAEMVTHAASAHDEKSQFKCTLCAYKSNNKISFDQHVNAKHPTDPSADYTMVYQKIKGSGPRRPPEAGETTGLDEPFDTTPLWRRDMPRIRHIRGILFEDEEAAQSETPSKSSKRKNDAETTTKSVKTKIAKSSNDSTTIERDNDSSMSNVLSDGSMNTDDNFVDVESLEPNDEKIDTSRLTRRFGPYGSPITHFWRCTICHNFKTKYKQDIRDHLFRDLQYFRFQCGVCGHTGVSRNSILKHFMRNHENRHPTFDELVALPVDEDLETWVRNLIKSQAAQMRGMLVDADGNVIGQSKSRKTNPLNARRSTTENPTKSTVSSSVAQATSKDSGTSAKTVDSNQVTSDGENKTTTNEKNVDTPEVDDGDSNDALVIDTNDDGLEQDAPENLAIVDDAINPIPDEPIPDEEPLLVCKHCDMKFERTRGFKLHVQIRHLRRLNFLCPYCDTSSNSEKLMRKHLRLYHANLPEQIDPNPVKNLPDLTEEFWEREYGISGPGRPKKRRRTIEESTDQGTHVCGSCGFRAINSFGLGVHMRIHAIPKTFKCAYCTFAASEKSDLWQHSEKNHPNVDWRTINGDLALVEQTPEITNDVNTTNDRTVDDYAEYVAAETSAKISTNDETNGKIKYLCFYCKYTRNTVEQLREHWKNIHKKLLKSSSGENVNSNTPFRYKEIIDNAEKKMLRCGYCPKRGLPATIRLHSRKKHASKPVKFVEIPSQTDNWICQWCNEILESEAKQKIHWKMFHSHLPSNYRRARNNDDNSGSTNDNDTPACPKCSFKTTSLVAMQKHVAKHVDSVRCKRCDKTFLDVTVAILHNTQAHPGEVSAIEGFTSNVEKIMSKINWRTNENVDKTTEVSSKTFATNVRKKCGVAKKSTTKSIVKIIPRPSDFRAVARKSTNPLPRYPPGIRFVVDDGGNNETKEKSICWYGQPRIPVNLSNISTYITLSGGRQMKLNCTTLAQLFNIEPRVLVTDVKSDSGITKIKAIDNS